MRLRRASNGEAARLAVGGALGVGGEARIFAVANEPKLAAKIYHRPTKERAAKLAAMLKNPPKDPMAEQGHVSIAWPADLLTDAGDNSRVMGFLMPLVKGMGPIIDYYHPKTRRHKHPLFNHHYLLRTARNLAACISALHTRGYVVGDLNESNILVADTSLVTLVDTDSFQVPDAEAGRIYRCRVGKVEFTPPELQAIRFEWVDRKREHDLFGLAVLIFQLLMEGIHPFAGKQPGAGEPASLEERIAAGWFPYAPGERGGSVPMPTAPRFGALHRRVRELFVQCFVEGHQAPAKRPDAQVWQQALLEAEGELTTCSLNDQHRYGKHLISCPWCERCDLLEGLDPFPSRQMVKQRLHLRPKRRFERAARSVWLSPDEAIAVAVAAIVRGRRMRMFWVVALSVATVALTAYWVWVGKLILDGE